MLWTRDSGDANPGPLLRCSSWGGLREWLNDGRHLLSPPLPHPGGQLWLPRQTAVQGAAGSPNETTATQRELPVSQAPAFRSWSGVEGITASCGPVLEAPHTRLRPQRSTAPSSSIYPFVCPVGTSSDLGHTAWGQGCRGPEGFFRISSPAQLQASPPPATLRKQEDDQK